MKSFAVFLLVLCCLYQNVSNFRFLAILPVTSKSHYYIGHNLMKGLAEQGHEVTVISPFKAKQPIKNYNEVFLEHSWEISRQTLAKNNFQENTVKTFWQWTLMTYQFALAQMNWTLSSKNFQEFLKVKQHFDVVVVEIQLADALLGFGQRFNAPVIALSAFGASKYTTDLVGSPIFPSYIPFTNNPYTDRMTFWQRMYNSLSFWFEEITWPYLFMPQQQKIMEEIFPEAKSWPSLEEIRRNVSLVLLNTHTTVGTPRPYAPNMIEVGGMQIQKEIEPLPQNIQTFLDGAKNGAILISLGSQLALHAVPADKLFAIVNAFKSHPNLRILIKNDEHVIVPSHKESDVLTVPWINQQSVLAHKNIKLFVSHGGLLGTTETVFYGKPVVGIPFMFDQHMNMYLAEQKGFGICVPFEDLSAELLSTAVNKILSNPSYSKQAQLYSERFRDQPLSPIATAMHWTLHVAKNKGAPHLRSVAVELPFYALYNLDVWGFIFGVAIAIFFLLLKTFRAIKSSVFGTSSRDKLKKS